MKLRIVLMIFASLASAGIATANVKPNATAAERMQDKVRHELVMLPYFSVFDNLAYKIEGNEVILLGEVTQPWLKSDAERAVKSVEGVAKVNNQIEVLPPSPFDDRIRRRLFAAIYGYGPLQRYSLGNYKPIRIIVKNGHVDLEGVVDNATDKTLAGLRANGVSDIFSVTNNLQVAK
jgi:hyperosmotically inducible periplasmic protein